MLIFALLLVVTGAQSAAIARPAAAMASALQPWPWAVAEFAKDELPPAPVPRLNDALVNATQAGAATLLLQKCSSVLREGEQIGVNVGGLSEEYARIVAGRCIGNKTAARPPSDKMRDLAAAEVAQAGVYDVQGPLWLALDRGLRFEHLRGETVGLMPRRFQLPTAMLNLAPRPADPVPAEHTHALVLVHRATDWVTSSARTLAVPPVQWAARQYVLALAFMLVLAFVLALLLACCARLLHSWRRRPDSDLGPEAFHRFMLPKAPTASPHDRW